MKSANYRKKINAVLRSLIKVKIKCDGKMLHSTSILLKKLLLAP